MKQSGSGSNRNGAKPVTPADLLRGRWDIIAVIALGGAAGGGARRLLGQLLPHDSAAFPWSTFLANVTGCFLLGVLLALILEVWPPGRYARPFLGVGVLGGYTTFSTFTADTAGLYRAGEAPLALVYLSATVAVGLIATWLGLFLIRSTLVPAQAALKGND